MINLLRRNNAMKKLKMHTHTQTHILFRRFAVLLITASLLLAGCNSTSPADKSEEASTEIPDNVSAVTVNYSEYGLITEFVRQDTVPDGYTGIYTIEDLDNIRLAPDEKYILMNNLSFEESDYTEGGSYNGGWTAIEGFCGIFDGNGYVISNLLINPNSAYFGLFGNIVSRYSNEGTYYYEDFDTGLIKNLGLNGVRMDISVDFERETNIGTIAASGHYILGCYADNVSMTIEIGIFVDDQSPNMSIGGICGYATIVDSCYANVTIEITDVYNFYSEQEPGAAIRVGGVAGYSKYLAGSYYSGSITYNEQDSIFNSALGFESFLPWVVREKQLDDMIEMISEKSSIGRDHRQFRAFYRLRELTETEKSFLYTCSEDKYYVLEPHITARELRYLEGILLKAYTEEEIRQGNAAEGIKIGAICCYKLHKDVSYTEYSFTGFDFESIWVMRDGVPKLRIFE